ncbi:MAG: hypothetical protein ABIH11_08065 [Candidatus Altiarchaeota archaeon]
MNKNKVLISLLACLIVFSMATTASAISNAIKLRVCSVVTSIYQALWAIAPSFVALMFIYGGVKYVYGGDDPGARKSGRNICVHAIIGGILIAIASAVISIIGLGSGCS